MDDRGSPLLANARVVMLKLLTTSACLRGQEDKGPQRFQGYWIAGLIAERRCVPPSHTEPPTGADSPQRSLFGQFLACSPVGRSSAGAFGTSSTGVERRCTSGHCKIAFECPIHQPSGAKESVMQKNVRPQSPSLLRCCRGNRCCGPARSSQSYFSGKEQSHEYRRTTDGQ
jgi:hypothetical protein